MNKKKNKKNSWWIQRQANDPYVQQAQALGYRSRAALKLLEIQQKYGILQPGMTVVDLGAAPGGWLQVAQKSVTATGQVIGLDILPIVPIYKVDTIQGDFTEEAVFTKLMNSIGQHIDVVLSDMAPQFSGVKSIDQPRAVYLAELALDFALKALKPEGTFLTKVFQGVGTDEYIKQVREHFANVKFVKPKSSRPDSREVYILAHKRKVSITSNENLEEVEFE